MPTMADMLPMLSQIQRELARINVLPTIEKIQRDLARLQDLPSAVEIQRLMAYTKNMAEQLTREKEACQAQIAEITRLQSPTSFVDYIRSVEYYLYSKMCVGCGSPETSTDPSMASVANKFYPQHFQPWSDFAAVHNATFDRLAAAFAHNGYFAPVINTERVGRELCPHIFNDLSLSAFLEDAIEEPASQVVSQYLRVTNNPRIHTAKFGDHYYGVVPTIGQDVGAEAAEGSGTALNPPQRPASRRSPVKDLGIPDRWLFALRHDNRVERMLVGVVKSARLLRGDKLDRVMSAPPSDDFFPRAAKQDGVAPAPGSAVPGSMDVAEAICEAYHYMISSGLEYGYVASGDGQIFLRVPEDNPNTLYYFWSVTPAHPSDDVAVEREPRETAMARMATLCMLASESTPRSPKWVADRDDDLTRWPRGSTTAPKTAAGYNPAARGVPLAFHDTDPSVLPFCTQGCLRSLCRGEPLDDKCPNVERHRAAACTQGGDGSHHALTASQLRSRLVAQLAEEMSVDCRNLLWDGYFGRYGVLFRLTATGFGYTFVGKAVQHSHHHVLAHEATVYAALDKFQGRLIPVCLGLVDLERSIPLGNCQYVAHMLLMAYAGPTSQSGNTPYGVDLEREEVKTFAALYAAGLQNDDIHGGDIAWNEETRCMMQFDFDQAYMRPVPSALWLEPAVPADSASPVAALSLPLRAKREVDEHQSSNGMEDKRD